MISRRLSVALLGASTALAMPHGHDASGAHAHAHQARSVSMDGQPIIVDLFEWNWNSVGQECKNFLGPAGYKLVQVSPASEHIQGGQWWTSYQKVSNKIQSKRGTRDEFRNMVSDCKNAGVNVLVDIIWNHMAGIDSGVGVAGTSFSHYTYDGLYSGNDFHYCGTQYNAIQNWGDQWQVQNCQLANLADLKTESEYVRQTLVNHGNDLLSLGVYGFRLDAGKHIPIDDLNNIVSRLSRRPYITSEVIGLYNPSPSTYSAIGAATNSDYYEKLMSAFSGGAGIKTLNGIENASGLASDSATVMVATHDSERNNWGLKPSAANNAYNLAHVFMLAYPYGTPTVYSSYYYGSTDDGAPNGGYGTCSGAGGANGFLCQHRWTNVASMVPFRKACGTASLNNWSAPTDNRIAFGRGSVGFVLINNSNSAWSASTATSLPAGQYCDVVAGGKQGGRCVGATVSVSGGKVNVSVPAYSAIAIYTGAKM